MLELHAMCNTPKDQLALMLAEQTSHPASAPCLTVMQQMHALAVHVYAHYVVVMLL